MVAARFYLDHGCDLEATKARYPRLSAQFYDWLPLLKPDCH